VVSRESLDIFPDDLRTDTCRVCRHPYPHGTLTKGVCDYCLDALERECGELGYCKNGRRKDYDDE
jgi:hypothetical protein